MARDITNHRLGAYIYGFLSGAGLILLIWDVALMAWLSPRNVTAFATLTFLGISLLTFGSCREAYLRGSLSIANASAAAKRKELQVDTGTQELVLYEQEPKNQA